MSTKISAPAGEIIWVQYVNNGAITHFITSTKMRDYYYLYKIVNDKVVKTKYKSNNPMQLEKYIEKGD